MASALFLQASPTALACILVLLSLLDFIAVTLRLYCRRSLKQPLRPDDWLVILGFLLSSGRLPVFIYSIARHATGYPTDSPDEFGIKYDAQATNIEKALYAITILTIASLWAVKLSFLFFYRRIFIIDERNYKDAVNIAAIVLIFLTTAWAIGFIVPEIFACRPISGFWESEVAKCINTWEWNQGEFIVDAVLDIAIIAFPIPLVWKMKLRRRQKVGVLAVFMIGALAIASSIWATFINFWMTYYSQDHDVDPNLMFSNIIFWNMIEPTLAILAACGPQLKGLVRTPAYVALKKYLLFVTRVELKETED